MCWRTWAPWSYKKVPVWCRCRIILQLGDVNWLGRTRWPQGSFQCPWREITAQQCNMLDENQADCNQFFDVFVEVGDSRRTVEWVDLSPQLSRVQFVMFLGLNQNHQREYKLMWHWYIFDYFQSMCWPCWGFISIFRSLWIQTHPYHLLNLWVRSAVLNLVASWALKTKQSRLVSPNQRLRLQFNQRNDVPSSGCFIWLTTSRGQTGWKTCSISLEGTNLVHNIWEIIWFYGLAGLKL